MSQRGLTVGSLLGVPQLGTSSAFRYGASVARAASIGARLHAVASPAQRTVWREGKFRAPPPIKLGRGCCRSGCAGCPWAEAQRRGSRRTSALVNAADPNDREQGGGG